MTSLQVISYYRVCVCILLTSPRRPGDCSRPRELCHRRLPHLSRMVLKRRDGDLRYKGEPQLFVSSSLVAGPTLALDYSDALDLRVASRRERASKQDCANALWYSNYQICICSRPGQPGGGPSPLYLLVFARRPLNGPLKSRPKRCGPCCSLVHVCACHCFSRWRPMSIAPPRSSKPSEQTISSSGWRILVVCWCWCVSRGGNVEQKQQQQRKIHKTTR